MGRVYCVVGGTKEGFLTALRQKDLIPATLVENELAESKKYWPACIKVNDTIGWIGTDGLVYFWGSSNEMEVDKVLRQHGLGLEFLREE